MRILCVAVGLFLTVGLLYLLIATDPAAVPQPGSEALGTDEEKGAPTLGTMGLVKQDEAEKERAAAQRLADELRDLTDKERVAILHKRFAADRTQHLPYSDELARLFLRMATAPDRVMASYGAAYLRMLGPRAAPVINEVLNADPDNPHAATLLGIIAFWANTGQSPELPGLLPFLGESRSHVRRHALNILREGVPYEPALAKRLMELFLERPDSRFGGAAMALARMGSEGISSLLSHAMEEANALGRIEALQAIALGRPDDLRPHLSTLSQLIMDPERSASFRSAAIYALNGMHGDCVECLPALRAALRDESHEFITPAVRVLEALGARAAPAVPELLRFLEIDDPRVADPTARVLGTIGARPDLVLPALDKMVRSFASDAGARAMSFFGPAALPYALKTLDEGDEYAQYAVLWAIAGLREKASSVVPRLLELMQGEDEDIALRAIGTLGYIGPKASAAVPEIMRRVHQGEAVLGAKAAAGALANMGADAEKALLQSLRSSKAGERRRALSVITHMHLRTSFAFDDLESLTKAKDAATRVDAYKAIGAAFCNPREPWSRLPGGIDPEVLKRGKALLAQGRQDKDPTVQAAVFTALSYVAAQEEKDE